MKNIKILDVYLDNNIGDDLMLKMFLDYYKNQKFYLVNKNPIIKDTFKDYKNLIFIDSLQNVKLKSISHYITIGGSVFNNTTTAKGKMIRLKRLNLISRLKKQNVKIITIGSNLGPFKGKLGLKLVQKELNLHNVITVRDVSSLNMIENNNKYYFNDIVSAFNLSQLSLYDLKEDYLGISIHNNKSDDVNYRIIQELVKFIKEEEVNNKYVKIKLFNFDIQNENDSKISNYLVEKVDKETKHKIEIHSYIGTNLEEFLEEYYSCKYMVGFRFHSLILSSLTKQKYLGFSYSNKMMDYANDRNFENVYDISEVSCTLLSNFEKFEYIEHKNNDGLKHFEVLEELF